MDISALAAQTTPKDPAIMAGEAPASTVDGQFAALLANSARQLGQAGLQSLSVNAAALVSNIQIAEPPPPLPPAAAQSTSAASDDSAQDPPPPPIAAQAAPALTPRPPAPPKAAAAKSGGSSPAADHHDTASDQSSGPANADQTASATQDQPPPAAPAKDPSTPAAPQAAQAAAPAKDAAAADTPPPADPTLAQDAAATPELLAATAAPAPAPTAGTTPLKAATSGDKTATPGKTAADQQDQAPVTVAVAVQAPPPVAPLAAAPAISAAAAAPTAAETPQSAAAADPATAPEDGLLTDPRLLGGATTPSLRNLPANSGKTAAAASGSSGKAPTAAGPAAADIAAFDPIAGQTAQGADGPTAAASQARTLADAAGQTPVTVTLSPSSPTPGLAPQSAAALVPSAMLFDQAAQAATPATGKTAEGIAGDAGHPPAALPASQPAPLTGLANLTQLFPQSGLAATPVAPATAADGQIPGTGAAGVTDATARLSASIATTAPSTAGPAAPALPQTTAIAGPGEAAALPQDSTAETTATQQTAQTSEPEEPTPLEQLKVQIDKGVKAGSDTINVQLRPEGLGRVEIKLEVQDGSVKATVTADKPETLQMMKSDAGGLQQALHDAGLNTDTAALSFQLRGETQQQQRQTGQNSGRSTRRIQDIALSADDGAATLSLTAARPRLQNAGGVDISV